MGKEDCSNFVNGTKTPRHWKKKSQDQGAYIQYIALHCIFSAALEHRTGDNAPPVRCLEVGSVNGLISACSSDSRKWDFNIKWPGKVARKRSGAPLHKSSRI